MSRVSDLALPLPLPDLSVNHLVGFSVCQMADWQSTLLLLLLLSNLKIGQAKILPVMNPEYWVKCRDRRKGHMSSKSAKSANPIVNFVMNALTGEIV